MSHLARESPKNLKKTWMKTRSRKISKKVKVGDHVNLWFDGHEGKYHAIITKVNDKSFHARCDDGYETSHRKGKPCELKYERGPDYPDGIWERSYGPEVDEEEFKELMMSIMLREDYEAAVKLALPVITTFWATAEKPGQRLIFAVHNFGVDLVGKARKNMIAATLAGLVVRYRRVNSPPPIVVSAN